MKYTYRMIGGCISRFCVSSSRESLETRARALQPLDGDGLTRSASIIIILCVRACAYVYSSQQQQHRRNDTQPTKKTRAIGVIGHIKAPMSMSARCVRIDIGNKTYLFVCVYVCVRVNGPVSFECACNSSACVCVHLLCWLNKLTHACANVKEKPTTASYLPMYVRLFFSFFLFASRVGSHVWRITPQ